MYIYIYMYINYKSRYPSYHRISIDLSTILSGQMNIFEEPEWLPWLGVISLLHHASRVWEDGEVVRKKIPSILRGGAPVDDSKKLVHFLSNKSLYG